jgi:hypothetical protein
MADQQIVCALSGVLATEDDYADTDDYTGEDADLPEGWVKVVVTTRRSNPAWEAVQEVKEITAMNLLGQVPEDARADVEAAVMLQIEAQFAALEARPEYARTLLDSQTLYIAPSERVNGLSEEITSLCETLGLDAGFLLPEDEGGDEGDEGEDGDNADQTDAGEAAAG